MLIKGLIKFSKRLVFHSLGIIDRIINRNLRFKFINLTLGMHNNKYVFKPNQICFVHVPKTAGTSTLDLMQKNNAGRIFATCKDIHRPISLNCLPKKYKYFAVMRDPVERVWSYYQMVKGSKNQPYNNFSQQGLEIFLENCWEARNMVCRYFSGEINKEPNDMTLKKSKINLDNFLFTIDFENYDEDIKSFFNLLNITINNVPHKRKVKYLTIKENYSQLIRKYNKYDLALYEYWQNNHRLKIKRK